MKIAMTGAGGLVGAALWRRLEEEHGHTLRRLVRTGGEPAEGDERIGWDPEGGFVEAEKLEGVDAVIHLAGESVADGRWTNAKMQRIRESRERGTATLSEALAGLSSKPATLISASAVGYYGDRGEAELREDDAPGDFFLSDVAAGWERATGPAAEAGIRVVNMRIGVVLAREGGALSRMLPVFKLGLGGRIGSGRQWVSWITLDDLTRAFTHCLHTETVRGPVNGTAPNPVRNAELTKALGRVLGRPTVLPLPAFAARLMLGRMADELLLASANVLPAKLQESGFTFEHETIEPALRAVLAR